MNKCKEIFVIFLVSLLLANLHTPLQNKEWPKIKHYDLMQSLI